MSAPSRCRPRAETTPVRGRNERNDDKKPGEGLSAKRASYSSAKWADSSSSRTLRIGQGPRRGPHPLGEEREDRRIQLVRLGELAGGPGEVPHLAWIRDDDRQARGREGRDRTMRACDPGQLCGF